MVWAAVKCAARPARLAQRIVAVAIVEMATPDAAFAESSVVAKTGGDRVILAAITPEAVVAQPVIRGAVAADY